MRDSKSVCMPRPATSTTIPRFIGAAGGDRVDVRADDLDLAVLDLVHLAHPHVLEGRGVLAAEFDVHVLAADPLALEGGGIGDGDVDLRDRHLDAPDLDAAGHDLVVVELVDDVLVGADARGQDLRDVRVGDDREAHVDRAGAGGVLEVVDLAESEPEGEHPVLAVLAGTCAPGRP